MSVGVELLLSTICINATFCPDVFEENRPFENTSMADLIIIPESKRNLHLSLLRKELNGKHLRIGTIENFPLSYTEMVNGTRVGRGVAFQFVDVLKRKLNFTYTVRLPARNWEGGYGRLEKSLLGMLANKTIDLAAAFLPILTEARSIVRYSVALDEGIWMMMLKRPRESAAGSGLLAPFDENVWYLILVAVIAYGPCIAIITRLRHYVTDDDTEPPISMAHSFWFVYGSFIKQGTTMEPESNTTRMLFATWWIFIILLSAFYTANLTAFLTLSKFTLDIDGPKDLLRKSWIAREGSAVEYVIANPNEDLYFLNKMVTSGRGRYSRLTEDKSYLKELTRNVIYIRDRPSVNHLIYNDYREKARSGVEEKSRCTYVITANPFMIRSRAFAYPINSTLPALVDPILRSFVEGGIVEYLEELDLPANEICPLDLQSKERRLRNTDLTMTYTLAGIGLCAAIAVFVGELLHRYWKARRGDYDDEIDNQLFKKNKQTKSKIFSERTRPPPYESLFGSKDKSSFENSQKRIINGRDYWVIKNSLGEVRLVPVRSPSAFLFQ
nr:ionotropic receptor [Endoclita signifer]